MKLPVAVIKSAYDVETLVPVKRRADHVLGFWFYAPGWRKLSFTKLENAAARIEKHPRFVRWQAEEG